MIYNIDNMHESNNSAIQHVQINLLESKSM